MTPDRPRLAKKLGTILDALALTADESQRHQLIEWVLRLERWNATYNLTAVRDVDEMLIQHVGDCLAVLGPMDRQSATQPATTVLDVGSGAGFPGSVIAVMRPALQVTCIDGVGKKVAFIRQAAAELGIRNLAVEHARVQDFQGRAFDLITSRALSELMLFTQLTRHLLAPRGSWMAMKGKVPNSETATLEATGVGFHVEQLTVPLMRAERCVIWMQPFTSKR